MFRIGQEEKDAVGRVIDSRSLFKINDKLQETQHLEEELKEKLGTSHALVMTSGKAALISALVALGIGPGDEVIVPGYTYIATAIAVVAAGAIPVICEIDETLTIDVKDAEKKITKYTKAIIPVHIQGFPCDMDGVMALAKKYDLKVVEDSCQSDGGFYHGKRLGTIGHAGAYSFNFFKIITCGEGGALVTEDPDVYKKALIYHDSSAVCFFGHQLDATDDEIFSGNEYRTNEISAAILREQLKKLDPILADLHKVRAAFEEGVKDLIPLTPSHDHEGDCATTISFNFPTAEKARAFSEALDFETKIPIDTGKHVYSHWTSIMRKQGALHPLMNPFLFEANRDHVPDYRPDMCPKTLEYLSRNVYYWLNPDMTEEHIAEVVRKLRAAYEKVMKD